MLDGQIATALFPPFPPITELEDKIMVGWRVKLDKTRSVIDREAGNLLLYPSLNVRLR